MSEHRRVEIVFDVACVLSYLEFTRFTRAVERYREGGGEVEAVFLPFQFRPDADPAGESLYETHKRDRGEAAAREVMSMTSFGADDGLAVDFARVVSTNTFDAHRLLARAATQGRGERMVERLFRAYFTDGVNVADHAALERLAAETDVRMSDDGADALRAELDRVRGLGYDRESLPSFRFEGGPVLTGEQPEDAFTAALLAR